MSFFNFFIVFPHSPDWLWPIRQSQQVLLQCRKFRSTQAREHHLDGDRSSEEETVRPTEPAEHGGSVWCPCHQLISPALICVSGVTYSLLFLYSSDRFWSYRLTQHSIAWEIVGVFVVVYFCMLEIGMWCLHFLRKSRYLWGNV